MSQLLKSVKRAALYVRVYSFSEANTDCRQCQPRLRGIATARRRYVFRAADSQQ